MIMMTKMILWRFTWHFSAKHVPKCDWVQCINCSTSAWGMWPHDLFCIMPRVICKVSGFHGCCHADDGRLLSFTRCSVVSPTFRRNVLPPFSAYFHAWSFCTAPSERAVILYCKWHNLQFTLRRESNIFTGNAKRYLVRRTSVHSIN